jgi:hypothetical protein
MKRNLKIVRGVVVVALGVVGVAGVQGRAGLGSAVQPAEKAKLPDPVTMTNQLGFYIQKGTEGQSLTTVSDGRTLAIQDGEATVENEKLNKPGLAQSLRIDHVSLQKETVLVKVILTPSKRAPEFVDAMDGAGGGQPVLVDTKGVKYAAAGFVYKDSKVTRVRFTQGTPMGKMGDAPTVTRNTPDRELTLLFVVNEGVELKTFSVGKTVVEDWTGKEKKVRGGPGAR